MPPQPTFLPSPPALLPPQVKQQVSPLQANEVAIIRKKCATFETKQSDFFALFKKMQPYFYECETPYETLDEVRNVNSARHV